MSAVGDKITYLEATLYCVKVHHPYRKSDGKFGVYSVWHSKCIDPHCDALAESWTPHDFPRKPMHLRLRCVAHSRRRPREWERDVIGLDAHDFLAAEWLYDRRRSTDHPMSIADFRLLLEAAGDTLPPPVRNRLEQTRTALQSAYYAGLLVRIKGNPARWDFASGAWPKDVPRPVKPPEPFRVVLPPPPGAGDPWPPIPDSRRKAIREQYGESLTESDILCIVNDERELIVMRKRRERLEARRKEWKAALEG